MYKEYAEFYKMLKNTDSVIKKMIETGLTKDELIVVLPGEWKGMFYRVLDEKETILGVEVRYSFMLKKGQGTVMKKPNVQFNIPESAVPKPEEWVKYGGLN